MHSEYLESIMNGEEIRNSDGNGNDDSDCIYEIEEDNASTGDVERLTLARKNNNASQTKEKISAPNKNNRHGSEPYLIKKQIDVEEQPNQGNKSSKKPKDTISSMLDINS